MKIGLAQINTIVGDFAGNAEKVLAAYQALLAEGAEIIVFPELVIAGYAPRDLMYRSSFVQDNVRHLLWLAGHVNEVPALVGYIEPHEEGSHGRRFFNAAAWCHKGQVVASARKCLLPSYDVFDEERYFHPAEKPLIVEFKGYRIGLSICEDLWNDPRVNMRKSYPVDPVATFVEQRVDIILNCSASPWNLKKQTTREQVLSIVAEKAACPVVYCNLVGSNDELIFDGHSMIVDESGSVIAGLAGFAEQIAVSEVTLARDRLCGAKSSLEPLRAPNFAQEPMADLYEALVLGIRDYAAKTGFTRSLVGLSGGIDSAVTATLAAAALGPQNVIGISLPSPISSSHSLDDAEDLADNLGICYHNLPIGKLVDVANKTLLSLFTGFQPDVTEENIQARARGLLLMAISNKYRALLLTTGNKSEMAVGYCTLYGDMCGALAVISDVPKTMVYELARWINRRTEIIPKNSITKAPSAELRPGQTDQDSLPPYETLDEILRLYVEVGLSRAEIVASGFEAAVVEDVCLRVDRNEYKRKQAAPGLKVTPLAFGVGRRMPIVQNYKA